jgi:hypothetical protein
MATFTVSTKVNKDAKAIATALTLVFDNPEVERTLATQQAVVRWQQHARKNGIPATAVLKLSDLAAGLRAETMTPEAIKARAAVDPVFRAQVLKDLGIG